MIKQKRQFWGMEYPFGRCARPKLLEMKRCLECSVRQFCEAPEKINKEAVLKT